MNGHDLVIGRFIAALLAAPALASGNVFEEETESQPEDLAEYVVVRFGDSTPDRGTIKDAPVYWTTTVTLECHARRDERGASGRASRRLHLECYGRLMADPSLGGAVIDLRPPRLTSDQEKSTTELGCFVGQYIALHRTTARTMEAA